MQFNPLTDFFKGGALEIKKITPEAQPQLAEFFLSLSSDPDTSYFHPHTFTSETAYQIASYSGQDLYYAMLYNHQVLGYGMLRGWDEGYEIPSLGIAIHPSTRKMGLGKLLMDFLHTAARIRGAKKVRLRVHPDNVNAIRLYTQLGYQFMAEKEKGQLVAYFNL